MFEFVKKILGGGSLSTGSIIFGESLVSDSKEHIKRVSLNNQPCQAMPTLIHINFNETLLNPYNVSVSKCFESFNTINDHYAQVCVPNKA